MLKFWLNLEWLAWPCERVSPLQQRAVRGAATVQAGIRLVTASPAEPLATAAVRYAFSSARERVLRKLVKHHELDEPGSISSFPLLLEAMIRHVHLVFDDTQLPWALMVSDPLSGRIRCRPWLAKKISKEFLDAKDRQVLEKEFDDAARTNKKHSSCMKALTPLRKKVLKQQNQ